MGRWLMAGSVAALGALNWAALHDILGGEADVRAEWTVVGLSSLLCAAAFARALRRSRQPS